MGSQHNSTTVVPPQKYLGRDVVTSADGLPSLGVTWYGLSDWTEYHDALYFDARTLNLDVYPLQTANGDQIVPVEEFCWVLEPERLCHPMTGNSWPGSWAGYLAGLDSDDARAAITHHRQMADYFVLQIQVFTAMIENRSYNVIRHFQECFSYTSLISLCSNEQLPFEVGRVLSSKIMPNRVI